MKLQFRSKPKLRLSIILLGLSGIFSSGSVSPLFAADDVAPNDAVSLLQMVEETRAETKPFRMRGVLKRSMGEAQWTTEFVVESEGEKYRIRSGPRERVVAIFDGERLLSYDGRDSAVITAAGRRETTVLAFDPRALGISTGLYSDHTLKKAIAYRGGKDAKLIRTGSNSDESERATIELIDEFGQTIRFELQPQSPYRVYRYSKTIPRDDRPGIFIRYVTETEYWEDDNENWLPRRLVMHYETDGDPTQRLKDVVVELEKPEFVSGFDPETWTPRGLSMPVGQPLDDLRILQRVGYWDGSELVETFPSRE